jgi:SAM-dependent methyltransferase
LNEDTEETRYDRHYIYHTAWAARKVKEINPKHHIDISSSLFFTVIVSAFIPVKFYDFRPADIVLSGLESKHADLTNLHFKSNSVKSLSCMHTMEHIGLGRYGDSIDPDGDIKAIGELKRVLAIGGNLLFVVPIGKPKIAFNAHRIYPKDQVLSYFSGLKLKEFVLIPDNSKDGHLVVNPSVKLLNKQVYGCGCFWFRKT